MSLVTPGLTVVSVWKLDLASNYVPFASRTTHRKSAVVVVRHGGAIGPWKHCNLAGGYLCRVSQTLSLRCLKTPRKEVSDHVSRILFPTDHSETSGGISTRTSPTNSLNSTISSGVYRRGSGPITTAFSGVPYSFLARPSHIPGPGSRTVRRSRRGNGGGESQSLGNMSPNILYPSG
jgi:hypothetical protein